MKIKHLITLFIIAFVAGKWVTSLVAQDMGNNNSISFSSITFKTALKKGEILSLTMNSATNLILEGIEKMEGKENEYKLTSEEGKVVIRGGIVSLYCPNNKISELDVTKAKELTELFCSGNPLQSLDLTHNTQLQVLNSSGCGLKSIDLKQNKELIHLHASKNSFETMDLTENSKLAIADCSNNKLLSLLFSKNAPLVEVSCYHNQIKGQEMDKLIASLRTHENVLGAATLEVYGEQEQEENVCTAAQVAKAKEKNWKVQRSNGAPFEGEEAKVASITMKTSKKKGEILVLSFTGTTKMEGLTHKGGQNYEVVSDKGTISIVGEVTELFCDGNQITHLDVSKAPSLNLLSCKGNELEKLDISQNAQLVVVNCSDNRLSELNVSHNSKLTRLFCSGNMLPSLDLSKNPNLVALECARNQIKGENTSLLIQSLPNRTKQTALGELHIFDNSTKQENNVCSQEQVAAAAKKNWKAMQYDASTKKWIDYLGSEPNPEPQPEPDPQPEPAPTGVITITTSASKGESIPLLITANGDFQVEGAVLRSIDQYEVLSDNGQISIKGNITTLDCTSCKVTALQVKQCPTLTALSCSDNQLSDLDLSNNPELLTLDCYSNRLTQLNLAVNVHLTKLLCALNQLESLELSHNKHLSVLNCYANRLTMLDLTQNSALKELICGRNKIKDAAMDTLILSLPDRSKEAEMGNFKVFDNSQNDEQNACTTAQVATVQSRGWHALQYKADEEAWVAYEGSKIASLDEALSADNATIIAIYTVDGRRVAEMQQGMYIIRLSNGTVRKVFVKK